MPPAKKPAPKKKRPIFRYLYLSFLLAFTLGVLWDGSPLVSYALARAIASKFPGAQRVTSDGLVAWMADPSRPPPLLVDARSAEEYRVSHLDGAIRLDPANPDLGALGHIPGSTPIVVYDAAGLVSAAIAQELPSHGYGNVTSLEGGIFHWANQGRPLVGEHGPASKVKAQSRWWGRLLKGKYRE